MSENISQLILANIGTGEDNAVTLHTLMSISGLSERATRQTVEKLRRSGAVICSSDKGYYRPADVGELRRYIHRERSRANSIDITLVSAERLLTEWGGTI
jgi:biotin operon repressor